MDKRLLGFLPIPLLAGIIAMLYFVVDPSAYYDPGWLIPVTNTLFVGLICFGVAFISMRNFRATGRMQILLLGCGVLIFGLGGVIAGFVRGLPDGANLNVTIYNTGALVGALFHFVAAIILLTGISLESEGKIRKLLLFLGYGGVAIFMALLTLLAFNGIVPPFFIQGVGPTPLRQAILGSADILFIFSVVIFLSTYYKNREEFLYWYSLALALTSMSLTAFFIQHSVGSPVGWAGRFSQYLGGIYFLVALRTAIGSAQTRMTSLDGIITSSLSSAEEKFRLLAENSPDLIDRLDRDMRHLYMNQAGLRVHGKPGSSVIGKTIRETGVPEPFSSLWEERIRKVFNSREALDADGYFSTVSGMKFYQSRCVPEFGADGTVASVLVISRDLTERKQSEQALRASEERLRMQIERMPIGCILHDSNSCFSRLNPAAEKILGYAESELLGKRVSLIVPEDVRQHVDDIMSRLAEGDMTAHSVNKNVTKDGRTIICQWTNTPLRNPDGQFVGFLSMVQDITESKLAEEALRESEKKYRSIIDNLLDGYLRIDKDGIITMASPSVVQMYGVDSPEELVGTPTSALYKDLSDRSIVLEKLRTQGRVLDFETDALRKDGTSFPVSINAQYFYDDKGQVQGTEAFIRDIKERKQVEEQIHKLNEEMALRNAELEMANKEMESFIYSVSHDLRGPLRTISGFSQLLTDIPTGNVDTKKKNYLTRIQIGAAKMSQLIDDLLRLSRISRQEMNRTEVDMSSLAGKIMSELREANPDRNVDAEIEEDISVFADSGLMNIALTNLLANAWKFTAKNANARIEFGSRTEQGKAVYYVKDNGVGFDQEYAHKMFLPFHRLHGTGEFEGTGIGLSIVERIIHRHGGRIWGEGQEGKGATVFFTLG